jgi:hypothetical protein
MTLGFWLEPEGGGMVLFYSGEEDGEEEACRIKSGVRDTFLET